MLGLFFYKNPSFISKSIKLKEAYYFYVYNSLLSYESKLVINLAVTSLIFILNARYNEMDLIPDAGIAMYRPIDFDVDLIRLRRERDGEKKTHFTILLLRSFLCFQSCPKRIAPSPGVDVHRDSLYY